MDFFKIKKFGKGKKSAGVGGETVVESDDEAHAAATGNVASQEQQQKFDILGEKAEETEGAGAGNGVAEEAVEEEEDDDDDDFITNEVKRRLKELRKNSFMVLIPEEECGEGEEDGGDEGEEEGSSSREWLESDVVSGFPLCGFDSLYDKYCERMLVFHKMIAQLMKDPESLHMSKKSPRSASKLASTLRSLSFKRKDELQEDCEQLQQQQSEDDPYQTLETAYVAHVSLSWEALHCTYVHLSLIVAAQPDNPTTYSCAAQAFQQFQKEAKVKELFKKKKGWKSKTWPPTMEEVQLLFALIDIKVVSRVLRMGKLSKEQLLWCEEKMSKLDISENRLRRDGSPILFPC
nr:unnamed protein product [Digitaria exilis]